VSRTVAAVFGGRWRDPRHPDFWMVVLLVAALALRVAFLVQPLPWFVSMVPADDFFYYAGTAHHLAEGAGSTIDGGLTYHNGYHPLFLWLLVPGFALGLSKTSMIFVAMAILVAAWLAAMVLARAIGVALGGTWSALTAPAIMGLNVEFAKLSMSGFETALVTALLLAVFLACLQRRPGWVVGLLLGLAALARLDSAMAAVPIAILFGRQRRWRELVVAGVVSMVVVSPWAIWSWANFGSPLPLSGVVKSWFGQTADLWRGPVVFARESFYRILGYNWRDVVPPEVALAGGAIVGAEIVRRARGLEWLVVYALGAPVVFALLTGSQHVAQFSRYCVPAFVLAALLFFVTRPHGARIVLVVVVGLVLWGNVRFLDWAFSAPPLPNYVGLSHREVPAVLDEILAPEDLVGCFDSGALTYFADEPVINLDGLVNAEVVEMLAADEGGTWERRYREYFHEKGITVIVGGTRFSWVRLFDDLDAWEVLHEPIPLGSGGEIVFLRVPDGPLPPP